MSTERAHILRRVIAMVLNGLLIACVVGWAIFLRPQPLGGPATYILVSGDSMLPTLSDGDLAILMQQPAYAVGDVVAYRLPADDPGAGRQVIHRIVGVTAGGGAYMLRGDNTDVIDVWQPGNADVLGRLEYMVPGVAQHITNLRRPIVLATLVTLIVVWMALARPRQTELAREA